MFVFDDVHSDAASGHVANVFGGGKAGMKEQISLRNIPDNYGHKFQLEHGQVFDSEAERTDLADHANTRVKSGFGSTAVG
jgi:hypothetical protein